MEMEIREDRDYRMKIRRGVKLMVGMAAGIVCLLHMNFVGWAVQAEMQETGVVRASVYAAEGEDAESIVLKGYIENDHDFSVPLVTLSAELPIEGQNLFGAEGGESIRFEGEEPEAYEYGYDERTHRMTLKIFDMPVGAAYRFDMHIRVIPNSDESIHGRVQEQIMLHIDADARSVGRDMDSMSKPVALVYEYPMPEPEPIPETKPIPMPEPEPEPILEPESPVKKTITVTVRAVDSSLNEPSPAQMEENIRTDGTADAEKDAGELAALGNQGTAASGTTANTWSVWERRIVILLAVGLFDYVCFVLLRHRKRRQKETERVFTRP